MSTVLVALVPALAGGILVALCVMSFLGESASNSPMGFKVLGGMGLLLGAIAAAFPAAVLILAAPPAAPKPVEAKPSAAAAADSAAEPVSDSEVAEVEAEDVEAVEATSDAEVESTPDYGQTDDSLQVVDLSGDEFDASEDDSLGESDIDFSEDEDEGPKKKKK